MEDMTEKQKSDFAELGTLVQVYIDSSFSSDSITYSADIIKYKIDNIIMQQYGSENLDEAKVNTASKITMENIDRARNISQADKYLTEMKKYNPSNGGMDLINYNNEKSNYDFYQNEIGRNDANIGRYSATLNDLTKTGINIGYNALKYAGEAVSLYQLGDAFYSDDQNEIAKTATTLGIGIVADTLIAAALSGFAVGAMTGLIIPLVIAITVGFAADQLWDHFEVGKKIGMRPGESFFGEFFQATGLDEAINAFKDWSGLNHDGKYNVKVYDPLVLDLDGDGIETSGQNGYSGVLFDHDNDGIRTATGWLNADDGFLVFDRNGDGIINNGSELFGDQSILNDGTPSSDGYAALADFDTDKDGQVSAKDSQFDQIKIWRDLNQNGFSETNELFFLDSLHITTLNISSTIDSLKLDNGNEINSSGNFEKESGEQGKMSDVNFSFDSISRAFSEIIISTQDLPNIKGSGRVRDLRESAQISSELTAILKEYSAVSTKEQQLSLLPQLVEAWAKTDKYFNADATLIAAFEKTKDDGTTILITPSQNEPHPETVVIPQEILEKYKNIIAYIPIINSFSGVDNDIYYTSQPDFMNLISKAEDVYNEFSNYIYLALLPETRLRPYLESIKLKNIDNNFILDFSSTLEIFAKVFSRDEQKAFIDLGELLALESQQPPYLSELMVLFDSYMNYAIDQQSYDRWSAQINMNALSKLGFKAGDMTSNTITGNSGDDYFYGAAGNDSLNGMGGNDFLHGGAGNDRLSGNEGNDTLDGGTGNDTLNGGTNESDTYLFAAGHGKDSVIDSATKEEQADTLRFAGARAAEARFSKQGNDLIIQAYGDNDTVTIPDYFSYASHRFLYFVFEDKTLGVADLEAMLMVVNGTAGNDYLSGRYAADILTGGAGNDTLYGNAGNDILDGGEGNDTLNGGTNESDTYLFSAGHGKDSVTDSATKEEQADTLRFAGARAAEARFSKQGNDLIIQAYGDDDTVTIPDYFSYASHRFLYFVFEDKTLGVADLEAMLMVVNGTAGNDYLSGWYAADILTGGAGNDTLNGNAGSDILDGGAGNDTLNGGTNESDTYLFAAGHGKDSVTDSATKEEQADTLRFAGARAAEARFSKQGNDLIIQAYGDDDTVTIPDYFSYASHRFLYFAFEDKTLGVADLEAMLMVVNGTAGNDYLSGWYTADILTGGAGNDTLYGNAGNDILDSGAGNDTLNGGTNESDTYLFAAGHGKDSVTDSATKEEQADTLRFAGARAAEARFSKQGNDLIIQAYGDDDTVTIPDYFSYASHRFLYFVFEDKTLGVADLEAMLMVVNGTAGNDYLSGWYAADILTGGAGNDTLYGNAGNDILDGGAGNDTLNGGTNESDTYLFAAGHGKDSVTDSATKEEQADTLRFAGARAAEARFSKLGNDLIIQAYGDDDAVTIPDYFSYASHRFLHFAFEDKTLGTADLEAMLMVVNGTEGNDSLSGWYAADILAGGAGDDRLSGNAGNDILDGGAGNDTLNGGSGSDTYLFAKGHGQDVVYDSLSTAGESDTLLFTDAQPHDLWFSKTNKNLLISEIGSTDSVTLENWFNGANYQNKKIMLNDGQYLESTQVQLLVEAMAVFSAGQDVSAIQPDQMKENMHMINSSDYWSHI